MAITLDALRAEVAAMAQEGNRWAVEVLPILDVAIVDRNLVEETQQRMRNAARNGTAQPCAIGFPEANVLLRGEVCQDMQVCRMSEGQTWSLWDLGQTARYVWVGLVDHHRTPPQCLRLTPPWEEESTENGDEL